MFAINSDSGITTVEVNKCLSGFASISVILIIETLDMSTVIFHTCLCNQSIHLTEEMASKMGY